MSNLKTTMSNDLGDVFFNSNDFAETATYNGSSTVSVLLDERMIEVPSGYDSVTLEQQYTIGIYKSEVATPMRGDTFLISSTTYTVDSIIEDDGDVAILAVTK